MTSNERRWIHQRLWFAALAVVFGTILAPAEAPAQRHAQPDVAKVPYGKGGPDNWLNIYLAEGARNGPPAPVYVWAHGNGGTADNFNEALWQRLSPAGISGVSWESVVFISRTDPELAAKQIKECWADFEDVLAFIAANAGKYNFDPDRLVVGGSSRGSLVSWPLSHQHPAIKGIYSTGALPDPVWTPAWDPRDLIHAKSPPLFFAYEATPGDGNVHNPDKGKLIVERYRELGIGDRAFLEHSLDARGLSRWEFIVDFILRVTGTAARRPAAEAHGVR